MDKAHSRKTSLSHKLSQKSSQSDSSLFSEAEAEAEADAEVQSQVTNPLSLIKDPLWRHIYSEALKMMGASIEQIWQTKLGPLSPKDTTIDLYCQTEEIAQIVQQCDFVILESIQMYFPHIKELRIKIN